jgi:predicted histone-like DNA-binding protein
MAKKKKEGGIRCLAHRTYLRSGSSKASVQGIRVDIMGSQKTELSDMAESIGYANTATPADVQAVWGAMEHEIIRALENGRRVSLGKLGTLRLEVGTKPGKSTARSITSKDIEAKGITFTPSKELKQKLKEFTFECDGIASHPLSALRTEEALTEHFTKQQYISARSYATLCHCSESTARRRIAQMLSEGKLMPSGIAKGLYKLKDVE